MFCQRLIDRWLGELDETLATAETSPISSPTKGRDSQAEAVEAEALSLVGKCSLYPELLINVLQQVSDKSLNAPRAEAFEQMLEASQEAMPEKASRQELAADLLKRVDEVLGVGTAAKGEPPPPITPLERAIKERATRHADDGGHAIREWLEKLVEDPAQRVKPAELAANRCVQFLLSAVERNHESLKKAHQERVHPSAGPADRGDVQEFLGASGIAQRPLARPARAVHPVLRGPAA